MQSNEHVSKIKGLVNGYKSTYILTTATRLGFFHALSIKSMTLNELAENLKLEAIKIEPILNALVNMELLDKTNGEYALTLYKDVLDPSSPKCQLGYVDHALYMSDKWRNLESSVKEKFSSLSNFKSITGNNLDETRAFLEAMNTNALPQAKYLVSNYNFENHKYIDIGAGYGTYSIEIAKKYQTSIGTALDLPMAAEIINENIISENLESRITVIPGNYKYDLPMEKFDDALLFAVIHQENSDETYSLIKSIYSILKDEGTLYLTSFFLDSNKTSPTFSVMFAVEMLVGSVNGKAYSYDEIEIILRNVGFKNIQCITDIPGPACLYIAKKI